MIPFFYTHYKKAPLATCVSFISSMFYLVTVFFVGGYIFNWSDIREEMSLGICLLAGAAFAVLGFGGNKLAEYLAMRKRRKLAAKAASAPATRVAPAPTATARPAATRYCPKCGAKAEAGDVFCVNCGVKLPG